VGLVSKAFNATAPPMTTKPKITAGKTMEGRWALGVGFELMASNLAHLQGQTSLRNSEGWQLDRRIEERDEQRPFNLGKKVGGFGRFASGWLQRGAASRRTGGASRIGGGHPVVSTPGEAPGAAGFDDEFVPF
jgi:hypothetical protein